MHLLEYTTYAGGIPKCKIGTYIKIESPTQITYLWP